MSKLTYNERSWAIDLISEINKWASTRDVVISRAGGENTLKSGKKPYFPDVLLYGDRNNGLVLQGWELKMPDTNITDDELFENAKSKANIMGLKSFLLWNVKTAILYKINDDDSCEIVHTWNEPGYIRKREDVVSNKSSWVKLLNNILDDLTYYFNNGDINPLKIVNSVSGDSLTNFILGHTNILAQHLQDICKKNGDLNDEVMLWWMTAKSEYLDYKKQWEPLSKLILVSWINKLTFAHLLKRYYKVAYNIENIIGDITIQDAIKIINDIGEKTNFKNVFNLQLGEEFIPDLTWDALKQINELLINSRIEKISTSSMQNIISNVVRRSIRKIYGQFTTPKELAAFIATLVVTDKTKNIMDTCCGTGSLPKECYNWKIKCGITEKEALDTIYASDKLKFPLQLAMITLTAPSNIEQVVNVFNKDVIDLKENLKVKLYNTKEKKYIDKIIPKMGYIISNLPFVQQEDLKKLNPRIQLEVNEKISQILNQDIKINSRADLYAYIPFKQWELLEEQGKLAIIVSNSWLATDWGNQFYELLNRFYHIEYIIGSNNGRWFSNADVVTNVLILTKRSLKDVKANNQCSNEITKFVLINEKISDLAIKQNKIDYDRLNEISTKIRRGIKDPSISVSTYNQSQIQDILKLGLCKNALFADVGWIFNLKDKLIKTSNMFFIARGERRGWDAMFYPKGKHNIEEKYIKPVLKSIRTVKGYIAEPDEHAFCCADSMKKLEQESSKGTLNWIKKFENGTNKVGKPLKEVLKRPNTNWYTMKPEAMADICISMNPGDRLFFVRLKKVSFVNQRAIRFLRKSDKFQLQLLSAILNSILGLFYVEALGFGRGLGALDLTATNLKENLYILNPFSLTQSQQNIIMKKFSKLEARKVYSITEELDRQDRIEFDNAVLDSFGLSGLRQKIKKSLLEIYNIRTSVKR